RAHEQSERRGHLSVFASRRARRADVASRRAPGPAHREPPPHPPGGARFRAGSQRHHPRDRGGQAVVVGPARRHAHVEAELAPPRGFFDDDELAAIAELRPHDEDGLVLARRVFPDGRTRAYAWGRSAAREDVATAAERLIAMAGEFGKAGRARPADEGA